MATFNATEEKAFWKHLLVTSIFSFSHNVFYSINEKKFTI